VLSTQIEELGGFLERDLNVVPAYNLVLLTLLKLNKELEALLNSKSLSVPKMRPKPKVQKPRVEINYDFPDGRPRQTVELLPEDMPIQRNLKDGFLFVGQNQTGKTGLKRETSVIQPKAKTSLRARTFKYNPNFAPLNNETHMKSDHT